MHYSLCLVYHLKQSFEQFLKFLFLFHHFHTKSIHKKLPGLKQQYNSLLNLCNNLPGKEICLTQTHLTSHGL